MSHSFVEIYLHVIFSTKERQPLIEEHIEPRLYPYLGKIAGQRKIPILNINGTSDHLHMLIKLHPMTALSVLIKELKSYSSGWLKREGIQHFAWQEGYGAFSISITHLEALKNYIIRQKEHHKVHTFAEEIDRLNSIWNGEWRYDEGEATEEKDKMVNDENLRSL